MSKFAKKALKVALKNIFACIQILDALYTDQD